MPSSHEDTVTMGACAAQERPITIGKTWRFLAAASIVLGLLALFAWALARDPKLIPSPLIGKEAPLFALDPPNVTGQRRALDASSPRSVALEQEVWRRHHSPNGTATGARL